ncbi:MAG TPA: (deoxy)nucleoside triphosphate pyrophosphohydrolase [Candidatus Angelobacter sp.]|nr:(deoxy)nucleoside triphosphate pyrophosphohydrolase [Candidatus Angelobacter sp.]
MAASQFKQVVAALILRENTILICQRKEGQAMALKWEFPGGKVAAIQHTYAGGNGVELHFYRVELFDREIENRIFRDVRWVSRKELPTYDFLEADLGLVKDISAGRLLE